jgi:formamidopyrimidine-DNA glycosylase
VTFNDARRFGAMDLVATGAEDGHRLLRGIGPEPLGNAFNEAYLVARLKGRMTPVKAALLDQRVVAGLGNIYVCEVLHRTGISPLRKAGRLSARRAGALVPAIRAVLEGAIAAGGSSLRDYRQADGDLGYFQHAFRVYGREGAPCPRAGCAGTVRRVVQSGRSSFYCPRCQR